ncbi:unannotated protein [freshwater metagenome]|uniref:Unannotated protein n=1 Tax=freshwater metagenome TaxID=449393 RepID=A0A6J7GDU8_9ZZZZ
METVPSTTVPEIVGNAVPATAAETVVPLAVHVA